MIKKICFIFIFASFVSSEALAMFNGDEDEKPSNRKSTPEGFLKKDEPYFTEKDGKNYVSQQSY